MSADNMIVVDPIDDKFRISMQFASDDEYFFRGDEKTFDTLVEAFGAAHQWEISETLVEYGVVADPRCFDHYEADDWTPTEGDVCSDHPTNGRSLVDGCTDCDPDHYDESGVSILALQMVDESKEYLMDCGA